MWEESEGAVIRETVSQEQVKCHLTGTPGHMTGYIYTHVCVCSIVQRLYLNLGKYFFGLRAYF